MAANAEDGVSGEGLIRTLRGKGAERALLVGRWLPPDWKYVVVSVSASSEDVVVLRVKRVRIGE